MQLRILSRFYQRLGKFLDSGLSVTDILNSEMFPDVSKIKSVHQSLLAGNSLHQALSLSPTIPASDLFLIQAAEEAGRLPVLLNSLSQRYEIKSTAWENLRKKLTYPASMLFLAGIAFPFPQLLMGKISFLSFLQRTLGLWLFLAAIIFFAAQLIVKIMTSPRWSKQNEWLIRRAPFVGSHMVEWYLEEYCSAMSLMLQSGITFIQANLDAAKTIPSDFFRTKLLQIGERLSKGSSVGEAFKDLPHLKKEDHLNILSGEKTGNLDEAFFQIHKNCLQRNQSALITFAAVVPKILYFVVVIYIAFGVVTHYIGYFDMLDKITEGT